MATMDEDTQQPLITNELSSTVTNIPGENMNVVDATPDGGSAADRLAAEDDDSSPILPNDEVPSSVDDPIRSSDHNESSAASAAAPGGEELESLEEFVSAPNSKQETETADAMAEFMIPPPVVVEKPRNFLGLRLGRGKHHSTTSSASSIAPTNDDEEKEKSKETDAKNKQDEESESQDEEEDDDESDSDSLGGSDEEDNDDEEEEEEEDQESAEQDLMIPQKRWGIPFRRNNGIDSNDPNQSSEEEEEEEEDVLPAPRGWFRGAEETRPKESRSLLKHDAKSQSVRSLGKMQGIGYQDAPSNHGHLIKKTQSMHSMPGIGEVAEEDGFHSDSRLEWKGGTSKNSLESMRVTTMDKKNERTWGDALKGAASAILFPEKAVAEMMDGDESDNKLGQYHFVGVDDDSGDTNNGPSNIESPDSMTPQDLTAFLVKVVRNLNRRVQSLEKEVHNQDLINTTWRARVETLEAELRSSNNNSRRRTSSDSDATTVYNDEEDEEEDDGIEDIIEPTTTNEGILLDLNDAVAPGDKIADLIPTEEVDLIDLDDSISDSNTAEAKESTKVLIPILDNTGSTPETEEAANIPVLQFEDEKEDDGIENIIEPTTREGTLLDLNNAVAPGDKISDLIPTEEVYLVDLEDSSSDSNTPEAREITKVLIPILDTGSTPAGEPETREAPNIPVLQFHSSAESSNEEGLLAGMKQQKGSDNEAVPPPKG